MKRLAFVPVGVLAVLLGACTMSTTSRSVTTGTPGTAGTVTTSTTPAAAVGSTANPVPFGKTADVDGWTVQVISVTPEAEDSLLHTPPPAGWVYEVYNVQATRTAADPQTAIVLNPRLLGASAVERGPSDTPSCYGGSPANNTVHQGGTVQDSTCVSLTTADAAHFILGVGEPDTTWFAVS